MRHLSIFLLVIVFLTSCGTSNNISSQTDVPTKPDTGIITGNILDENNNPIEGIGIYVATIESESVIGFSINNAPRGISDATGTFVIPDIQPGTYALAYWTPGPSGLIGDPKGTNQPVKVTVVANQTVSAGKLTIKRP